MRVSGTYRLLAVLAMTLVAIGAALISAGEAWSAPVVHYRYPVLRISAANQQAQLRIPVPACPTSNPDCVWMLFVNEPNAPGQPVVGMVTGTSGVLTVAFPDYCGLIQADALIGPAPWVLKRGVHRVIDGCTDPTTTTTTSSTTTTSTEPPTTTTTSSTTTTSTEPPTTTTSTEPPTTTTSTSTSTSVPPNVAAGNGGTSTTTTVKPSSLPFTGSGSNGSGGSGGTGATAAQLPFTGSNLKPLIILGSLMVLIGLFLLSTVESRRRTLRRAAAINLAPVKDGVRRTSSWFLGQ